MYFKWRPRTDWCICHQHRITPCWINTNCTTGHVITVCTCINKNTITTHWNAKDIGSRNTLRSQHPIFSCFYAWHLVWIFIQHLVSTRLAFACKDKSSDYWSHRKCKLRPCNPCQLMHYTHGLPLLSKTFVTEFCKLKEHPLSIE